MFPKKVSLYAKRVDLEDSLSGFVFLWSCCSNSTKNAKMSPLQFPLSIRLFPLLPISDIVPPFRRRDGRVVLINRHRRALLQAPMWTHKVV